MLTRDLGDCRWGNYTGLGDYYLPLGEIRELPSESPWDAVYIRGLQIHSRQRGRQWERSLRSMYLDRGQQGKLT